MSSNTTQTARYRHLFFFFSFNILSFYIGYSRCLYGAIDSQKPLWRDEPQERPIQIQKHNPQEEQTKQQQRRRRRLEFVHIPKTGGTAIESIASHANITWSICHFGIAKYMAINSNNLVHCGPDDLKHNWPKIPKFNHCPWWHVPPAYIEAFFPEHNPYAGADLFAVVRNPYDRIISEYYYPAQDVAKENIKDSKANNVEHFNQKLNQKLSKFLSGMRRGDLSSRIPGNNVYFSGSGHMIPQHDFIYDDKHRRIVEHVLRFENLQENFAGLMAKYDLAIRLPERKFRHSVGKELSVHNLTKENILLIETIYWDDFREFGYEVLSLKE